MALYAFDGTWNVRDSKAAIEQVRPSQYGPDAKFRRETAETNVHRFKEFYGADRGEYVQGVGTRFGALGRVVGGAFGFGGKFRIRRMYRALCERYFEKGDTEIDVIGFSRGAALAVHFTNVVQQHGLRNPNGPKHLLWKYYPGLGLTFRHPRPAPGDVRPAIRFLGLWDTVGSFGLPVGPFRNRLRRWRITEVPAIVQHAFHAMALDEVRATFALVRPTHANGPGLMYEIWFRGVHSNVGGGYLDRGLSDIPLAWMMEMYLWTLDQEGGTPPPAFEQALRQLQPEPPPLPAWLGNSMETLEPDPDAELGRPSERRRQAWRQLPEEPKLHHSVFRRSRNLVRDHYAANRQLLRRIPRDAVAVFDPPFFYTDTPRQEAEKVACDAFKHIPVRSAEWLKLGNEFVFRGDDWVAVGQKRGALVLDLRVEGFVRIATEWLMSGRADHQALVLPTTFENYDRNPVASIVAAEWVVEILKALQPYVRTLRDYVPPIAEPRTNEPRTSEPRTTEPRTTEPRTTEPRTSEPRTYEPEPANRSTRAPENQP